MRRGAGPQGDSLARRPDTRQAMRDGGGGGPWGNHGFPHANTPFREFGSLGEGFSLVCPGEGLGERVVALDEGEQLRLQVLRAREDDALEQPPGEDREPELDLV